MHDLLDEDLLSSAAAANYLNGRVADARFTPVGIWRWMTNGLLAADGQRVFLEHARLGRKPVTSKQAMARFAGRLTQRKPVEQVFDTGQSDARAELTASGFFN